MSARFQRLLLIEAAIAKFATGGGAHATQADHAPTDTVG